MFEDTEQDGEVAEAVEAYELDEGADIEEAARQRHFLAGQIANHRGQIKRLEKELKDCDAILQAMMFGRKAIKTVTGFTLVWRAAKRAGYTVPPWEGERWEVRAPH